MAFLLGLISAGSTLVIKEKGTQINSRFCGSRTTYISSSTDRTDGHPSAILLCANMASVKAMSVPKTVSTKVWLRSGRHNNDYGYDNRKQRPRCKNPTHCLGAYTGKNGCLFQLQLIENFNLNLIQ